MRPVEVEKQESSPTRVDALDEGSLDGGSIPPGSTNIKQESAVAVKSERHRPLQRVLEMVKYLADHRFGAEIGELAKEMDMTPRNVYRYLRAMDEAGVGIERSGRAQWEKFFSLLGMTLKVRRDIVELG